jgi:hypothetical protein
LCRNIRVLHNFKPPTTRDEMHEAALQYVRKISGLHHPPHADERAFSRAVIAVTAATEKLLEALESRGEARTREGEREKARARWLKRETALRG